MDRWVVRLMKVAFLLFLTLLLVVILTGIFKFVGLAFSEATIKGFEVHLTNVAQILSGITTAGTLVFLILARQSDLREQKSEMALKIINESVFYFVQNLTPSSFSSNYPRLVTRILLFKEQLQAYKSFKRLTSSPLLDDIDWEVDKICERFLSEISLEVIMGSSSFSTDENYSGNQFDQFKFNLKEILTTIKHAEVEDKLLKVAYQLHFTIKNHPGSHLKVFAIFGVRFSKPINLFHGLHTASNYVTRDGFICAKKAMLKDDDSVLKIAIYYASLGNAELAAAKLVASNFMGIKSIIAK